MSFGELSLYFILLQNTFYKDGICFERLERAKNPQEAWIVVTQGFTFSYSVIEYIYFMPFSGCIITFHNKI